MMSTPLEEAPLLESFVKGDDAYRNSRFKLIPYISKVGESSLFVSVIVFCTRCLLAFNHFPLFIVHLCFFFRASIDMRFSIMMKHNVSNQYNCVND